MLLSDDADGFNDRQLFAFPPQRDVFLRDLVLPIPSDLPSLEIIYGKIRDVHNESVEYVLEGAAVTEFEKYHDNLVTRQGRQSDENIQGILSKVRGFTARLSMILFTLKQAIAHLDEFEGDDASQSWLNEITAECVVSKLLPLSWITSSNKS